jgi:hypothetical protein
MADQAQALEVPTVEPRRRITPWMLMVGVVTFLAGLLLATTRA